MKGPNIKRPTLLRGLGIAQDSQAMIDSQTRVGGPDPLRLRTVLRNDKKTQLPRGAATDLVDWGGRATRRSMAKSVTVSSQVRYRRHEDARRSHVDTLISDMRAKYR
jgi:hypothetical protein